jgi:prepilin-type N-terminal cleavage/methylation domain-containing protein
MRNQHVGDEDGFSLVEVLISIVIIGICFAGLLAGMGTAVMASGIHRDQTDGHALLVSAAEAVEDQSRNPFSCTTSTYKPLVGVSLPAGWAAPDVHIATSADSPPAPIQHGYWNGTGFTVTATCTEPDASDPSKFSTNLQRITVIATSPSGRTTERLTIIKRRP